MVSDGSPPLIFPNFDTWSEDNGLATTHRQMEVARDHFGPLLFITREHAVAAAMYLSKPDGHKKGADCDCALCRHYKKKALAKKLLKDQLEIEI